MKDKERIENGDIFKTFPFFMRRIFEDSETEIIRKQGLACRQAGSSFPDG
jgi:hypothetical protein